MRLQNTARSAYAQPGAPLRSPRSLEYDLLARMTHGLRVSWETRRQDFPALADAIAANCHLWSTLAADVATPGNALPQALRAQLLYLYQFVEQHSRKILNNAGEVAVLIDINTAVMRGLRGDPGQMR